MPCLVAWGAEEEERCELGVQVKGQIWSSKHYLRSGSNREESKIK